MSRSAVASRKLSREKSFVGTLPGRELSFRNQENYMKIDDLRDFLETLDEFEEVQRIKAQVDWNLEMGAITRRCYDLGAPAALFENIKGYPAGFRALGAPLGASKKRGHSLFARTALALGMRPSASPKEIMQTYLQRKENFI